MYRQWDIQKYELTDLVYKQLDIHHSTPACPPQPPSCPLPYTPPQYSSIIAPPSPLTTHPDPALLVGFLYTGVNIALHGQGRIPFCSISHPKNVHHKCYYSWVLMELLPWGANTVKMLILHSKKAEWWNQPIGCMPMQYPDVLMDILNRSLGWKLNGFQLHQVHKVREKAMNKIRKHGEVLFHILIKE